MRRLVITDTSVERVYHACATPAFVHYLGQGMSAQDALDAGAAAAQLYITTHFEGGSTRNTDKWYWYDEMAASISRSMPVGVK